MTSCFVELPMTSDVRVSNVTDKSVFVAWEPVEGADEYRLMLTDSQMAVIIVSNNMGEIMGRVIGLGRCPSVSTICIILTHFPNIT